MLRGVAARALHLSRGAEKPSGRVTYIVVLEEIPRIFGVLTCDDMDQALNRAGGKAGNKGVEAALTAADNRWILVSLRRQSFLLVLSMAISYQSSN